MHERILGGTQASPSPAGLSSSATLFTDADSFLLLIGGGALLLLALALILWHGRRDARQFQLRQQLLEKNLLALNRQNAELTGRLRSMGEILGSRQADLARLVAERLDRVGARLDETLDHSAQKTGVSLTRLNERLAVIDAAQTRLAGLTQEVLGLKNILANKQARGAFGQGRMEAIVRDNLPAHAYAFQPTLSNRMRPDCLVRLPGDERGLVIDAKFPLESFTLLRQAADDMARKQAASRVRADVGKHVNDIAERYFLPGETQDIALLFVPSESLHADLHEYFEDLIQKAHRQRILIVSPSLLVMAIQVTQAIVRDACMREQAHIIQDEVRLLMEDVAQLRQKAAKLSQHFRLASEDLDQLQASSEKISRRGTRIEQMDFSDEREAIPQTAGAPSVTPSMADLFQTSGKAAE
ncbi:DNA recombination protein RmuC [Beijerinckia mobilis]|uniref:DNA recombination protein RmuC n=1 Tax=Beijerinckia mobilis TaxID=231434 RepID=UPI0009FD704E|nr:DNA recombination protein RmuC [Beijerinckia mobilis]